MEKTPMKRLIIIAALFAAGTEAQSRCGPVRKVAQAVRAKFEGHPVRTSAARVVSFPSRVVEAQPVRTVIGSCVNGICPK
jgi:hypothetical protein